MGAPLRLLIVSESSGWCVGAESSWSARVSVRVSAEARASALRLARRVGRNIVASRKGQEHQTICEEALAGLTAYVPAPLR